MTDCKTTHNCSNCPTRQTTEWRDLSESELTRLDEIKRSSLMEPGETIFFQGDQADGIYCIQSGLVGLRYVDEYGNSALIRLCGKGTTIGYGALLSKEPYATSAEILTPSAVCFLNRSTVSDMLAKNPNIGERFLQHSIKDLSESEADYARSLTQTVRLRFLHLMMIFYERLGYFNENGDPIVESPLLRREIAELLGAQPESISRVIRSLKDDGLLQFNGKQILYSDMNKIRQEVGIT